MALVERREDSHDDVRHRLRTIHAPQLRRRIERNADVRWDTDGEDLRPPHLLWDLRAWSSHVPRVRVQ